jgi:S1-C subfamily serine protease
VGLALLQLHQVPRPALEIARTALTQSQAGSDIFIVDTTSTHGTPAQKGLFAGRESLAGLEPSLLRLNLKYANGGAGSPVFNAQQQLIGLLTRPVPNADDSCYALPAERLQRFLADVRSHGKPVNSGLGLVVQKTATAPRILGCRESSPAERAGVEPDDLVLSVGPTKINSMQELIDSTEYLPVETPVEIRVLRGQQIKTLKITPSLKTQALQ